MVGPFVGPSVTLKLFGRLYLFDLAAQPTKIDWKYYR